MATRIALFGGSFNPIHHAHLLVARHLVEQLQLDRFIFLPSAQPPHKQKGSLLDDGHRAAMVKLAIEGEPVFEFSDYDLTRPGPSYTIDTAAHFRETLGMDIILYWVIGGDSLSDLTTWYRVRALVDGCQIITVARPGWDKIDWDQLRTRLSEEQIARLKAGIVSSAPRVEISATEIRHRIRAGKSARYLVPDVVRAYMESNGLYQPRATE